MYAATYTSQFQRDVKTCTKRHWEIDVLKEAIEALLLSDDKPLDLKFKNHSLQGQYKGYFSIHVPSKKNPHKDQWVLMYTFSNQSIVFVRTGTHDEVYGS